jgi:hypothetical protein
MLQSLPILCELVEKGFLATFATKLLRVPPMPNETELSTAMGTSSCCAPASRCCQNHGSGMLSLRNPAHLNHFGISVMPNGNTRLCKPRQNGHHHIRSNRSVTFFLLIPLIALRI